MQRDLDLVVPDFNTLLVQHNLPKRPIDINEYAWPSEQTPAHSVFYLSQLERHDLRGLRANWGSGAALHDNMADLVFHNATTGSYSPNGEWYLYKYYADMVGERVATAASADAKSDVFAVVEGSGAKILAGTRTVQGTYEVVVSGLSRLGLPTEGSVQVRTLRFDWAGAKVDVGEPVDLGVANVDYSSDTVSDTCTISFHLLFESGTNSSPCSSNFWSLILQTRRHLLSSFMAQISKPVV